MTDEWDILYINILIYILLFKHEALHIGKSTYYEFTMLLVDIIALAIYYGIGY